MSQSKIKEGPSKCCQICKLKFTKKTALAAHSQAVHKINKRSLKEERKNKTTPAFVIADNLCLSKIYLCDICDETLADARTFELHFLQIHNSKMAHACGACFERFPKEDMLSHHKKSCKK